MYTLRILFMISENIWLDPCLRVNDCNVAVMKKMEGIIGRESNVGMALYS